MQEDFVSAHAHATAQHALDIPTAVRKRGLAISIQLQYNAKCHNIKNDTDKCSIQINSVPSLETFLIEYSIYGKL